MDNWLKKNRLTVSLIWLTIVTIADIWYFLNHSFNGKILALLVGACIAVCWVAIGVALFDD